MQNHGFMTVAAFALALAVAGGAGAQTDVSPRGAAARQRLITVTGTGEVRLKPDQLGMTLGIEERGQDIPTMRKAAAEKAQTAIRAIKALGVKDSEIQTSRLNLRREWIQEPNKPPTKFLWVLSNAVTVKTAQVDKAGELLDAVVKAGFNDVNGPYFSLSDPSAARTEALVAALRNAREKADALAKVGGVTIAALESVTEAGSVTPQPLYGGEMAMMRAAAADVGPATPVEAGEVTISASLTAAYRIQ
jgi:uncharacterized protein YggE